MHLPGKSTKTREITSGEKLFKIGEHEVVETVKEGELFAYLKCIKCGLEAKVVEVEKLTSTQCRTEEEKSEKKGCEWCGGEAVGKYPVDSIEDSLIEISLCSRCLSKAEDFFLKARPIVSSIFKDKLGRDKGVKAKHPLEELDEDVAWVSFTNTWFTKDGEQWICPTCGYSSNKLLETVKHFVDKHPETIARRETVNVDDIGRITKTWQGFYCPACGLLLPNEDALREHYKIRHGGV